MAMALLGGHVLSMVRWCLEHRMTVGLNVKAFYATLGLPAFAVVAARIGLNDKQRLGYWRSQGRLPYAVYLALEEAYGGSRDVGPRASYAHVRQPTRLPMSFQRFVEGALAPGEAPLEPAPEAPAAEAPVDRAVNTPPYSPHGQATVPIQLGLAGEASLTVRIEVQPVPPPPALLPDRERQLLQRIQTLQDELAELTARRNGITEPPPADIDPRRPLPPLSHRDPRPPRRT